MPDLPWVPVPSIPFLGTFSQPVLTELISLENSEEMLEKGRERPTWRAQSLSLRELGSLQMPGCVLGLRLLSWLKPAGRLWLERFPTCSLCKGGGRTLNFLLSF